MNKFYRILLSALLATNSVMLFPVDKNELENRQLEMQFAPTLKAPFTQEKDDQYFAELLGHIIKVDKEFHNDPTSMMMRQQLKDKSLNLYSITDFLVQDKSNYLLITQDKSFGWSAPGAILSALWTNGTAATPNELMVTIEQSNEFPGKYKAIIKGNGLYPHEKNRVKSAQSELTNFINNSPSEVFKYEKLEDIIPLNKLKTDKDKLQKNLPALQGHVKCDKYFHGTDVSGVIYFDGIVAAYLLQEINGNRHKNNSVSKKTTTSNNNKAISQPALITIAPQPVDSNSITTEQSNPINQQNTIDQTKATLFHNVTEKELKELIEFLETNGNENILEDSNNDDDDDETEEDNADDDSDNNSAE